MNTTQDIKTVFRINDLFKREQLMRSRLQTVRNTLQEVVASIQKSEHIVYTGWVVLVKKVGDRYESLGCFNPEIDGSMPEDFDMCIPIPDPRTLPELDGF